MGLEVANQTQILFLVVRRKIGPANRFVVIISSLWIFIVVF
jgi:hypothetical protein